MLKLSHIIYLFIILAATSCKNDKSKHPIITSRLNDTSFVYNSILNDSTKKIINEDSISFYYWKSGVDYTNTVDSVFKNHNIKNIYLHYFDVDVNKREEVFPKYVVDGIDEQFVYFGRITPVVFITNRAIKNVRNIDTLAEKIHKLTDQISDYHFHKKIGKIQVDCDWNQSTKEKFFKLLKILNKYYQVSATIRLHQIKYKDKTGIPPVEEGVIMVYNIGDLKNMNKNSILQSNIVAQYVNEKTTYPLPLKMALPLFSQIVIKNNDDQYRLASYNGFENIEKDKTHFNRLKNSLYNVRKDTLFKGFYLSPGYQIKIEKLRAKDIIESYKIVKSSKMNISDIIFYHLDDNVINNIDLNFIIKEISK